MLHKEKLGLIAAVAVVFFALWFRLEYQANTIVDHPLRADAGQYVRIAFNIVEHGVVSQHLPGEAPPQPDSYRGPGYPLLVAAAMLWSGVEGNWFHALLVMQAVLGTLTVALTILIARRWLPDSYAIAAGLVVAIWPHTVTMSGYILTETFFGFTLVLATYLLCRAESGRRALWYALAGLVFSYAALINPSILLFPVLLAAFFVLTQRKYAVVFLLCALIVPLLWSARGALLESGRDSSGRLVENVLAGMEPQFDYVDTPAANEARSRYQARMESYQQAPLDALHAIAGELAAQPGYYLKWYLWQKPQRLWQWSMLGDGDIYVYPVNRSPFFTNPFYRVIASICHSLNTWLLVAAVGAVLLVAATGERQNPLRKSFPFVIVVLLFMYATALHMALTPDPRYATAYRPFEIMLAVSLVALLHQRWREKRTEEQSGLAQLDNQET
jgi:4-amino-4-deoxy-L-arabinose transferase-like glycosyltransferase